MVRVMEMAMVMVIVIEKVICYKHNFGKKNLATSAALARRHVLAVELAFHKNYSTRSFRSTTSWLPDSSMQNVDPKASINPKP